MSSGVTRSTTSSLRNEETTGDALVTPFGRNSPERVRNYRPSRSLLILLHSIKIRHSEEKILQATDANEWHLRGGCVFIFTLRAPQPNVKHRSKGPPSTGGKIEHTSHERTPHTHTSFFNHKGDLTNRGKYWRGRRVRLVNHNRWEVV